MLLPVMLLNKAVDEVPLKMLTAFFCHTDSAMVLAAVEWVRLSKFGWFVGSLRPSLQLLRVVLTTAFLAMLTLISRLQ